MRLPIAIIDRYILSKVTKPLLVAAGIGLLVLLSERLVRLLDITLGKKNSFSVVFEMLGYLIPHYAGVALPAALFLGLLFGFNRLSKDSELDAMFATGIGMHRLVVPVASLALIMAMLAFFLVGWAQPYTRYAFRSVLFTVKNVQVFYLAEEGVFMQAGRRTFIVDELARGENRFASIFLYDQRGEKGSETLTARKGRLIETPNDPRPTLVLEEGVRLRIEGAPVLPSDDPLPKATAGSFTNASAPLGKVSNAVFRPRGKDARELTLTELLTRQRAPPANVPAHHLRVEFHKRLVTMLTILILPFLALPFAMGTRRGQRNYRFAVAMTILIAYKEIVEQGAAFAKINNTSPVLAMWLPFVLLAIFAIWRFRSAFFSLRADQLEPVYARIAIFGDWLWGRMAGRFFARES